MNVKTKVKDCTITIRCSHEDREEIVNKAKKENKSVSEYVLETAIAGRQSFQSKEKKRMCYLIEFQEEMNQIYDEIQNREVPFSKTEVIDIVNKVEEGVLNLWQN